MVAVPPKPEGYKEKSWQDILVPKAKLCSKFGEGKFLVLPSLIRYWQNVNIIKGYTVRPYGRKLSDYGVHLRGKQKLRLTYCLMEKQFKNYFVKAAKPLE
jgi:small subunit ribosomal protein S4